MRSLITLLIPHLFSLFCFSQGSMTYHISVKGDKGQVMNDLPLTLIEKNTFERIEFKTNNLGKVDVILDHGEAWVLHVKDMKNYKTLEVPKYGDAHGSMSITYNVENWNRINEPHVDRSQLNLKIIDQSGITEKDVDQKHSIVKVTLKSGKGKAWSKIEVQMTCYKTNTIYRGFTNSSGAVSFKLPTNNKYQIDVDGEPDYDYCDIGEMASIRNKSYLFEKIEYTEKIDDQGYLVQTFKEDPKATSNRTLVNIRVMGGPNDGKNEIIYIDQAYSSNKFKVKTDNKGEAQILLPKQFKYLVSFEFQPNADVLDLSEFRGISETSSSFRYIPDPRLEHPEEYVPSSKNITQYDLDRFGDAQLDETSDELVSVTAKWGNKLVNSSSREAILEIGFRAKQSSKKLPRQPVNISFVLDKSGSMGGENFDMLKKEMLNLIEKLSPEDHVSVIFFDNTAKLAYPQSTVDKNKLIDIIHTVQADGGTNILDGLMMGYQELEKNFDPGTTNRVILLTDGYGSRPVEDVLKQSESYFQKQISVSAIGVGEGYNESLLNLLSHYSGGFKHHVITPEQLGVAFKQEFEQLYTPIAKKLDVEIKYNDMVIYKTLYGIQKNKESNQKVTFSLPQVYATMNKLALVKFKLNEPNQKIEDEKITITTSYYDEYNKKDVKIIKELALNWTDETDIEMIEDAQMKQLYSVATINQVLKAVADLCDDKNFGQARENLNDTYKSLKKLNQDKFSAELQPLMTQIEIYLKALDHYLKNMPAK
ncbi:MAG: VWA domain-containing protein [Flavobacteriales bacterium]|nr:VWA domain-containing protein [Flavobacteriales bacterium]